MPLISAEYHNDIRQPLNEINMIISRLISSILYNEV
jgi:hypothetical protein